MARSVRKGPYVEASLLEKINRLNQSGKREIVKTWSRRSMVVPDMIGHTFHVHNGRLFMPVFVTENMIGHRLGEFAPTRKPPVHSAEKKVKTGPGAGPPPKK
jgi:small subunit ribosomal protein S19